jgi:hypothetical protein
MKFEIGAMSVGDILDRGLKILFARLPTLYSISFITLAPLLVYQLIALPIIQTDPGAPPTPEKLLLTLAVSLGTLLLLIILPPIGNAAILHVIGKEFVDERIGIGEAFSFSLGRFWSLLGTSMLYGLIFTAGLCSCCVPGFIVAVFYGLYAQIVVMEGIGGMPSLNRSKMLVTGFGWRLFFVYFLLMVVLMAVNYLLAGILEAVFPAYGRIQTPLGMLPGGPVINFGFFVLDNVIVFLVSIFLQVYLAVCTTLVYLDLRIRKEGFDLELAARKEANEEGLEPQEPGLS